MGNFWNVVDKAMDATVVGNIDVQPEVSGGLYTYLFTQTPLPLSSNQSSRTRGASEKILI